MPTLDEYDVPREQAEKVLKLVMTPYKELVDNGVVITPEEAQTALLRLGILSMALSHEYKNEEEYQAAVGTVSRENVRLQDTIMTLSLNLAEANKMIEELSTKLTELQTNMIQ